MQGSVQEIGQNGFSQRKEGSKHKAWSTKTWWVEAAAREPLMSAACLELNIKVHRAFSVKATRTTDRSEGETKEHCDGLSNLLPRILWATRGWLPTGTPSTVFVQELRAEMWLRNVACLRSIPHRCWRQNKIVMIDSWRGSLCCPAHKREKDRHSVQDRLNHLVKSEGSVGAGMMGYMCSRLRIKSACSEFCGKVRGSTLKTLL